MSEPKTVNVQEWYERLVRNCHATKLRKPYRELATHLEMHDTEELAWLVAVLLQQDQEKFDE